MVGFKFPNAALFIPLLAGISLLNAAMLPDPAKTVVWKLENPGLVGGYKPQVLGRPAVLKDKQGGFLSFNGINDGLIVPFIPIEGRGRFTIEVLFKPDGDGPVDPRFIHFQDQEENRGTFEIRINKKKQWYLDTFLKNGKPSKPDRGLSLIDSTLTHPSGRWYWAAMVYDGKRMTSYVNAVKELEGDTNFPVMSGGEISFGVRLNKVNWFKGAIKEVRFHPAALDASALQR